MNPSAIVLNVCTTVFITLLAIFSTYLIVQARKLRLQKASLEAKEVPLFTKPQTEVVLERKSQMQFAKAE